MKRSLYLFIAFFALLLMAGCSAMLVPSTDDPAAKLKWAQELVENQGRPIPAEQLIREAIEIYQGQKNEIGLAMAYRVYGLFFKAPAIVRDQIFYKEHGFLDKSAHYETRLQTALEYFDKSRTLLESKTDIGMLANIYLQIGLTHQLMGQTDAACSAFDKSLKVYKGMMTQDLQTKVVLPKDYTSFESGMLDIKRRAGCKG
jgi:tetratricopeptide (TPR) repeat protein